MAIGGSDALLFGAQIKFDKTGGVTDADINNILNKIQNMIKKKELWVKIGVDPNSTTFIRNYGKSASELTAKLKEANRAIERLQQQGNYWNGSGLTKAAQQVQQHIHELTMLRKYSAMTGTEFERMIVKSLKEETKERERAAKAAQKQAEANKKVGAEMQKQHGYLENLIRRLAVYASIGAVGGFLTKIREVTAQFELQRVSLGAIIQDQNRANQLFSEIKQFALKSPVKILDLTKYVKQVAAYRIETDKLFDTTKRLADVSVGLGVDMQRIVLAYGQVKAASYLRAAEVRQFTEAGIPLLELLAEKFSKLNGEMVTTEEVMEMISKRGVGFEMVEEIFKDMTDAGGIFYNMQEKQGNTLYGMWQKLGDAASVMYDKIGNTGAVNDAMKGTIRLMTDLMRNWKATAAAIGSIGALAGIGMIGKSAYKRGQDIDVSAKPKVAAAEAKATAATQAREAAQERLNKALATGTKLEQDKARASLKDAQANEQAAQSELKRTTGLAKLGAGFKSLMSSMATGLGIGAAITAVTALVYEFKKAYDAAHAVEEELGKIRSETPYLQMQGVDNFIRLAEAAVHAANGSKEQKEALDELQRTYKDMIPEEQLSIENLSKLRAGAADAATAYQSLTDAVEHYIAAQQKQKEQEFLGEHYGTTIIEMQQRMRDNLVKDNFMNDNEIARLWKAFEKTSKDTSKNVQEQFVEAMKQAGLPAGERFGKNFEKAWEKVVGTSKSWISPNVTTSIPDDATQEQIEYQNRIWQTHTAIGALADAHVNLASQMQATEKAYRGQLGLSDIYIQEIQRLDENIANMKPSETLIGDMRNINTQIIDMMNGMVAQFQIAGVDFKQEWVDIVAVVNDNDLGNITKIQFDKIIESLEALDPNNYPGLAELIKFIKQLRERYNDLVPSNTVTNQIRQKFFQIEQAYRGQAKELRNYLMGTSETTEAYLGRLKQAITNYKKRLYEMRQALKEAIKNKALGEVAILQSSIAETQSTLEALEKMFDTVDKYVMPKEKKTKEKKAKGKTPEDTRLQAWSELVQLLEKANQEYDKLEKKEGPGLAAFHINESYAKWFEYINKVPEIRKALSAIKMPDFEFKIPANTASLKQQLEIVKQIYEYYKGLGKKAPKGILKSLLDLGTQISSLNVDMFQKQIEEQLKEIAEKISQGKAAKDFYDKILSQTGDVDLATSVTLSIYGEIGEDVKKNMVEQILALVGGVERLTSNKEGGTVNNLLADVINFDTNDIDFLELEKWVKSMKKTLGGAENEVYKELLKIAKEGQKEWSQQILNWEKDLAKAKDYEEKRTEIMRQGMEERAEILQNLALRKNPEEMENLLQLSRDKEAQAIAKVNFEEFTGSDEYIRIFEDLNNVSTNTLKNLRERLLEVIETNKDLDPTNMKTLVKALENINDQIEGRGFGNMMISSVKDYISATKELKLAKQELSQAEQEYMEQEIYLNDELTSATWEQFMAQKQLDELKKSGLATDQEIQQAQLRLNEATTKVALAEGKKAKAAEKVKKANDKVNKAQDKQRMSAEKFKKDMGNLKQATDQFASALGEVKDLLEISDDSAAGIAFDSAIQGLERMSSIYGLIITLQEMYNAVTESNPWMAIAAAVLAVASILGSAISNAKVAKANKEIETQERILHGLEYSYGRLQKAQEKLFGTEYIQNYNRQLANLQAQAEAYRKQYEAEKSKGKKADKDAMQGYMDSWRDTMDQIKDMQDDLKEYLLGTDLTSAARDWANAWLEARWSFEDTTEAMKENFADMVQNMIVESMAARIMENVLRPVYDAIDMAVKDKTAPSAEDIAKIAELGYKAIGQANVAMEGLLAKLQEAGLNLQDMFGEQTELTGISRDIATASEESINGLAQGINTQNYYIAFVSENVAAIRAIMEGGAASGLGAGSGMDLVTLQNEHLSQLPMIEANTRATAERCERAAIACEAIQSSLERVIEGRGNKFVVNTTMY